MKSECFVFVFLILVFVYGMTGEFWEIERLKAKQSG